MNFTVELNSECGIKQQAAGSSQGRVPIGTGPDLSQGRVLFVPGTAVPKMFMFIGFFLARFRDRNKGSLQKGSFHWRNL